MSSAVPPMRPGRRAAGPSRRGGDREPLFAHLLLLLLLGDLRFQLGQRILLLGVGGKEAHVLLHRGQRLVRPAKVVVARSKPAAAGAEASTAGETPKTERNPDKTE